MRKTDIRNPFYEDIRKNGIVVDVQREDGSDPPSSNPYYERIAAAGGLHTPGAPGAVRSEGRPPCDPSGCPWSCGSSWRPRRSANGSRSTRRCGRLPGSG